MTEKMMRFAGKDEEGLAKGVRTDSDGYLKTSGMFKPLIKETLGSSGRKISPDSTWESPFLDIAGFNTLVLHASPRSYVSYSIEVSEYVFSEQQGGYKLLRTKRLGKETYSGPSEYIKGKVDGSHVKINVINNSAIQDLEIGLYLYATYEYEIEIKNQEPMATEDTLLAIMNRLKSDKELARETPLVPELENVNISQTEVQFVQDFQDGFFYGTHGLTIFKSIDGEAWEEVTALTTHETINRNIAHLFVTTEGRMIAACYGGEVFISDTNGVFSSVADFESGKFNHNWGTTRHANIIGFTTYEKAGFDEGQKHEAFISQDNGKTFVRVWDNSVFNRLKPLTDKRTHLHDIEYDPYSGRLFIFAGDFGARALYYSDNWGEDWTLAGGERDLLGNATQLVANPKGLALGADTGGGGLGFVNIDRTKTINPTIRQEDFEDDYWRFKNTDDRYLSTKKWVDRKNNIYLIPACAEFDYDNKRNGYLLYSYNGYDWNILWESPDKGHMNGLETIVYGNGILVGSYKKDNGPQYYTFTAEVDLKTN